MDHYDKYQISLVPTQRLARLCLKAEEVTVLNLEWELSIGAANSQRLYCWENMSRCTSFMYVLLVSSQMRLPLFTWEKRKTASLLFHCAFYYDVLTFQSSTHQQHHWYSKSTHACFNKPWYYIGRFTFLRTWLSTIPFLRKRKILNPYAVQS